MIMNEILGDKIVNAVVSKWWKIPKLFEENIALNMTLLN